MLLNMLKSKIHNACVSEANLFYIGSITIDQNIMEQADIIENEKVQVVNNNNGARIETYVIAGERNSKIICLNGAAARFFHPKDQIIIMSYCTLEKQAALSHKPRIIILNQSNEIVKLTHHEIAMSEKHI